MFVMTLSGLQIGYAMLCINRIEELFKLKYNWTKAQEPLYMALLTAMAIVGLAAGGFTAGVLMTKGRKRCMLISIGIGVTGVCIEMVDNFWVICFGRLIYGFACGVASPCIGRYIEETVPMHLVSALFPIYTCGLTTASIIVMLAAFILPKTHDSDIMKSTSTWRYFLAVPLILYSVSFLGIMFLVKYDTPKYLLSTGREEEALVVIK